MSRLGWTADGIERALACGGVPLERYRRPGFVGGDALRRTDLAGGGTGLDLDPTEVDPDNAELHAADARRRT